MGTKGKEDRVGAGESRSLRPIPALVGAMFRAPKRKGIWHALCYKINRAEPCAVRCLLVYVFGGRTAIDCGELDGNDEHVQWQQSDNVLLFDRERGLCVCLWP